MLSTPRYLSCCPESGAWTEPQRSKGGMNEGEIQPRPSEQVAEWTSHYFSFYIHTLKAASGFFFFFQYSTISLSLHVFRTVQMGLSQKASWSVGGSQCQPRGAPSRQVVPVQSLITEAGGRRRQEAACLIAMPGFFLPTTSVSRPGAQVRRRGDANLALLGQPQQALRAPASKQSSLPAP